MHKPRSILIVKLSAIGDVVHTLPLLEVLHKGMPEAAIDWLIEEEAAPIIEGHEAIRRILISRRKSWQSRFFLQAGRVAREIQGFLRELRSVKYDVVIDVQGLLKSGLLTGLSRGHRKMGFSWAREGSTLFLSEPPYPVDERRQHAITRYLRAAEILGCPAVSWEGRIPVRKVDGKRVEDLLSRNQLTHKKLLAVNPMARWETKLWETKRFALLADRMSRELGLTVLFTGGPGDRLLIEGIRGRMDQEAFNLAGQISLKELAYLYTRCEALISTDTGPMHIAAAMGCPVVALFGPTAPLRTGPYGPGHLVVRQELECSPCLRKKCDHKSCMNEISVDSVLEGLEKVLYRPDTNFDG